MSREFILALEELEKTKKIPREVVFEALEKALIKSYEKNYNTVERKSDTSNLEVHINRETGDMKLYAIKDVVEKVENEMEEISLEEAQSKKVTAQIGDKVKLEVTPKNFGRIAAQTARNIVIQKIKDAERDVIYNEFVDREKEIITGTIQRIDRNNLYIDLGRIEGIVPLGEQINQEKYEVNQRLKLFIKEVKNTPKGAQVILSRTDNNLVRRMLELEVPEINDGIVEIYSIAREAGSRTKLAVYTNDPDVDPVGACVGFKGVRVKSIVDELNGEKLDIIIYDKECKTFISNSLSPAEVIEVFVNEKRKTCRVIVSEDQLSLAIGKEGQNARLAAKLTSWKIDIKGLSQYLEDIQSLKLSVEFEGEIEFLENQGIDTTNLSIKIEHPEDNENKTIEQNLDQMNEEDIDETSDEISVECDENEN